MKISLCRSFLISGLFLLSFIGKLFSQTNAPIYIYANTSDNALQNLTHTLLKFGVNTALVDELDPQNDSALYIVTDITKVLKEKLPKYYIVYQTTTIDGSAPENIEKLSNAVCVWDCSHQNLSQYKNTIYSYYYFPSHYEFEDPVILPCLLPLDALKIYKELLIYSNKVNTDISSHLPILFAQCIKKNPQIIVEAGVRGGESTIAFSKIAAYCKAQLIGIDIADCSKSYTKLKNAQFLLMDDLNFPDYYKTCDKYKDKKIDIIFIDTSHVYEQTKKEIEAFVPLLNTDGCLIFHDANVTPLENHTTYVRINGTKEGAPGNPIGEVCRAIENYFGISFNPNTYTNVFFEKDAVSWHFLHYPFCNGLTIIEKVKTN